LFLTKQSVIGVRKRAGFLSSNRIPKLLWDSESQKAGPFSDMSIRDVFKTSQGCHT
jgi:hypothetical protein